MAESGAPGLSRAEKRHQRRNDWYQKKWGNKEKQPKAEDEEDEVVDPAHQTLMNELMGHRRVARERDAKIAKEEEEKEVKIKAEEEEEDAFERPAPPQARGISEEDTDMDRLKDVSEDDQH